MPHRNPTAEGRRRRPVRLRDTRRAFWLSVAVGFAVGAVLWSTYVVVLGLAGVRPSGGTLLGTAVVGGLVGYAALMPALSIYLYVLLDDPRAARWAAAGMAGLVVLGLCGVAREPLGWPSAALAVAGAAAVFVLAPVLLLQPPGPSRTPPRRGRGRTRTRPSERPRRLRA